jgi:hypothetical protein
MTDEPTSTPTSPAIHTDLICDALWRGLNLAPHLRQEWLRCAGPNPKVEVEEIRGRWLVVDTRRNLKLGEFGEFSDAELVRAALIGRYLGV